MTVARFARLLTGAGITCTTALAIGALGPAGTAAAAGAHPVTVRNVDTAMHGEAFANASYHFYAAQAGHQHLREAQSLFARTSETELHDHFTQEARLVHFVRDDADNLRQSIKGEVDEATRLYPRFAAEARQDRDDNAARFFAEIAQDEKRHAKAFKKALHAITHRHGRIPAGYSARPVTVVAGRPEVHAARTLRNLDTAMHGEAFAHARYTLYAEHARKHCPELSVLFRRTAAVELTEHFAEQAKLAGAIHDTADNLRRSIAGETREATRTYPGFARAARSEGDLKAARLFTEIARDEATHARDFSRALHDLGHSRL